MTRALKKSIDVTDTELAILDVLWREENATIRQITEAIYQRYTLGEYATVQKLLDRLEAKGCVIRDKKSFAHQFRANVNRSQLISSGLEQLARKLCGGSLTPLLVHLTEDARLSAKDRKMLRKLVDES